MEVSNVYIYITIAIIIWIISSLVLRFFLSKIILNIKNDINTTLIIKIDEKYQKYIKNKLKKFEKPKYPSNLILTTYGEQRDARVRITHSLTNRERNLN